MNYAKQLGISFIELIIALIIFSVLCVLAYPNYWEVIIKTRRAEARSALHALMLQQENYYLQHNTYFAFNADTPNSPFKWWSGQTQSTSYYEIHARSCPNKLISQCVLLIAIPGSENVLGHHDPLCGNLMLDSANNKSNSESAEPNSICW